MTSDARALFAPDPRRAVGRLSPLVDELRKAEYTQQAATVVQFNAMERGAAGADVELPSE